MKSDNCNRKKLLFKEFTRDWDELNIAFKSLIIIGVVLFVVVMLFAFFSDGGKGIKNSLEVVFRSTLASVFGFLLSSNIKSNSTRKNTEIQNIQLELKKIQSELDELNQDDDSQDNSCNLEDNYLYKDINLVQILISLSICILSICILGFLLITDNLENIPAVSQLRDLMCSSIGFLIGESGKK